MVGPAGFEPTDGGVKVLCLTAWRRPIMKKDRAACITVRSLVGCLERFELSASRATIWRANQLRHRHHMRPKGLEPPAHCLEGSCSIQLSYGRRFLPTKAFARDIIATPGAFVKRFFNFFQICFLKAIPHNSKCRYGERGTPAAKQKAQIILCVLSSIFATQRVCRSRRSGT